MGCHGWQEGGGILVGEAADAVGSFQRSEYYYAYVLMTLYRSCTERWWAEEYSRVQARISTLEMAAAAATSSSSSAAAASL